MEVRSDWALELQLRQIEKVAERQEVKTALSAVLAHIAGGGRNRRGGRQLLTLLGEARDEAAAAAEWQVVRLVLDSIDYAEGRILKPEFEERYRLFQDGADRDRHLRDALGGSLRGAFQIAADEGANYLSKNPEASVEEVIEHMRGIGKDAQFLHAPVDRPGRYRIVRGQAELSLWLEQVLRGKRIDVEDVEIIARELAMSPEALAVLAADRNGQLIFGAAELQRRASDLRGLRRVVEDRRASELDLQRALEGQHWIFGGRFIGEAAHRRLVPGDEVDIPLIRGDGALHVVELKLSMNLSGPLVKRHRNAWVPSGKVHDAVGQAVNYLVGLDENRERIRRDFGVETRRASALVLIGHPALQSEVPEDEINETLRTLNTHLSRVEVLTYKELVDNAERSLGGSVGVASVPSP
ncbi:DUF4263 domain-containing protein [Plantactinospora sp. BC1]|uniref:Shedu anti-phage system protein SduA domain-containing protein n=1 Tax=Plantactinospora sp. BC1 TaxID=2108470 RepID=UPI000D152684|nr:Shedu anti-phage system protein SduA domain-containing protein [Plantactinospora sp. BC1]AVT29722.1 DUF4263 domain-containing protein [Plantactinospora sp. BC1]